MTITLPSNFKQIHLQTRVIKPSLNSLPKKIDKLTVNDWVVTCCVMDESWLFLTWKNIMMTTNNENKIKVHKKSKVTLKKKYNGTSLSPSAFKCRSYVLFCLFTFFIIRVRVFFDQCLIIIFLRRHPYLTGIDNQYCK